VRACGVAEAQLELGPRNPLLEEVGGHLRVGDVAQDHLAGGNPLLEGVVPAQEVLGARRGADARADAQVGHVVGAEQSRPRRRLPKRALDLARVVDNLGCLT